jgi:hypothetical protein
MGVSVCFALMQMTQIHVQLSASNVTDLLGIKVASVIAVFLALVGFVEMTRLSIRPLVNT